MAFARDTTAPTNFTRDVAYDKRKGGLGLSYGRAPVDVSKLGISHALQAPQTASGARNTALSHRRAPLQVTTSAPLSHGARMSSGFSLGDFMQTMSMGLNSGANSGARPRRTTRSAAQRSGGGLSAEGTGGSIIPPRRTVTTGTVDGGANGLSQLRQLAGVVLGAMGSGGGGDGAGQGPQVHPASATTNAPAERGGISPLMIAGAALAVGVVYYAAKK